MLTPIASLVAMYAAIIGVTLVLIALMLLFLNRCYMVVGVNQAIVKTGFGAAHVTVGGGTLVFPVINQIQVVSLVWQPVEIRMNGPLLRFADQSLAVTITVWIAVDTTEPAIIEAAQDFGSQAGELEHVQKLYRDPIGRVIEKAAAEVDASAWLVQAPEIHGQLMQAIESVLEGCHVVHRATLQPSSELTTN